MIKLLTLLIITVFSYAYRLFAWQDITPLSASDIAYMIPFTLEHMLYTVAGYVPVLEHFEDGSYLIHGCAAVFCN